MDRSRVIYLISMTRAQDRYGVWQEVETKKKVFANVHSVSMNEWFQGGRNGLNPRFQMTMFSGDYADEDVLEYDGVRYTIYRTFLRDDEQIELYVELRKGNQ